MKHAVLALFLSSVVSANELEEIILTAARNGDLAQVKAAVEKGAPVEAKTRHGVTPLFYAAGNGHLDVVRFLLEKGADVNVKDSFYGMTALSRAVSKGHLPVVKLMLDRGAGPADAALFSGVTGNKPEIVKTVLESGKATESGKKRAMELATLQKKTDIVEVFKQAGVAPPEPAKYITLDAAQAAKLTGKYSSERQGEFVLTVKEDGSLTAAFPGGQPILLKAVDEKTFHVNNLPGLMVTMEYEQGKVKAATLDQMGNLVTFKKVE